MRPLAILSAAAVVGKVTYLLVFLCIAGSMDQLLANVHKIGGAKINIPEGNKIIPKKS